MKKTLLTEQALEKLNQDYEELIAKRQEIAEEIKRARGFGDLSENAEYQAAREAQSQNESEIKKIKDIFENYELVEKPKSKNTISIGSKVKIEYTEFEEIEEITIVTKVESDPINGLISNESPVGTALMGQKKGATVEVSTPAGTTKIKVIEMIKK